MPTTTGLTGQANPQTTTILFCENIAKDDFIWVAKTDADGLKEFLFKPTTWVHSLKDCPGWLTIEGEPKPSVASLTTPFHICVDHPSKASAGTGGVVIEGISGTGFVRVKPGGNAARNLIESLSSVRAVVATMVADSTKSTVSRVQMARTVLFDTFWDQFRTSGPNGTRQIDVFVDESDGIFYGHLPIWSDSDATNWDKPTLLATFLATAFTDPEGYVAMLNQCEIGVTILQPNGSYMVKRPRTLAADDPPMFALPDGEIIYNYMSDGTSDCEACDIVDGTYGPSTCTITTSTLKDYVPSPTPHSPASLDLRNLIS
ncbi:MAG TPA: hypothetical protein VHE55_08610 [Fimbriimonadaceae bacterium]|nr:hypothetical protein [Fimbriimonadaceae bacterium]